MGTGPVVCLGTLSVLGCSLPGCSDGLHLESPVFSGTLEWAVWDIDSNCLDVWVS